jgi:predicted transglutaminase-like cysteine proteinase
MFGRAAASGIAAFLLVLPAPCRGDINALYNQDGIATALIATTHDPPQAPAHGDALASAEIAALDPTEPPIVSITVPGPAIQSPALAEPFGLKTVPVERGELLAKWTDVQADISAESEILAHCREGVERCSSAAQTFLAIIADGRAHSGRARIGVINRAINLAIHPTTDLAQWGIPDLWSAPLITLSSGRGDCEDYAIAKYVALREAGLADDDVRLVIVRNLTTGEDHAVVAARLDGNWIVLDNRWLTLVEDTDMRRVTPLFVLTRDGVKQYTPTL